MITVTINREPSTDHGTEGTLSVTFGEMSFSCRTLELPWRANRRNHSCIPAGRYICRRVKSEKFGETFEVMDVEDRTGILFHVGNFAGDTDRGYRSDSDGCILTGASMGNLGGQKALCNSEQAHKTFIAFFEWREDFFLEINEMKGD
jgi:hypothetical protein